MSNTNPIPFWGKVKPIPHYFDNHSIRFAVMNKELYYTVIRTTKQSKTTLQSGKVTSNQMLEKLIQVKSFDELQTIEVVN